MPQVTVVSDSVYGVVLVEGFGWYRVPILDNIESFRQFNPKKRRRERWCAL